MSINYNIYLGPYYYISLEEYQDWVDELPVDEFVKVELEDGVAFIPNRYGIGQHLDPKVIDKLEINLGGIYHPYEVSQERTFCEEAYKGVAALLPEGAEVRYGLLMWQS